MKFIPCLRFAWATLIIAGSVIHSIPNLVGLDGLYLLVASAIQLVPLIFAMYCVVIGVQEIIGRKIVNAKFFELFGLFFEFVIFLGGLDLIYLLFDRDSEIWRMGIMLTWEIGVLAFFVVDLKRLRTA